MTHPFSGRYRARCTRVVDGDTIDAVVDLGFRLTATMRLRLWGINTAEVHDKDLDLRKQAAEATQYVVLRTKPTNDPSVWSLRIETLKDPDVFGRWLAKVWYTSPEGTEIMLNDELVSAGLAVEFRR